MGVTSSACWPVLYTGTPVSRRSVAGAGTGKVPCAICTVPPPTFTGDDTISSAPNHSSANTAPTMSMIESSAATSCRWTLFEGHVVDRGFRFADAPEQRFGARLSVGRQPGPIDQPGNFRQRPVLVMMAVRMRSGVRVARGHGHGCVRGVIMGVVVTVCVLMTVGVVMAVFLVPHGHVRGHDAGAHHPLHHELVVNTEAAEGIFQRLQRQARIQERGKDHVAGGAGETVEVQHARHQTSSAFLIDTKFVSARIR